MANRSDFYSAKLPRELKRMWLMGNYSSPEQRAAAKKAFIGAHTAHVDFKKRKGKAPEVSTEE
jgi:hypothetical protein